MTTLNYPIKIGNLKSTDTVKESLERIGLQCTLTEISPVHYELSITGPDMTGDDILMLGSLIGSIETLALRK